MVTIANVTLALSLIATIVVATWIIVPIIKTVLPYAHSFEDEHILLSRIAVRIIIFLFVLKALVANTIIFLTGDHGNWVYGSDATLSLVIIILIAVSIKTHPDGIKGL